jgi:glycosyltransferase involved in cell wall biosynthesis
MYSVIIPTFNRGCFIKSAIDSILTQGDYGVEIIIVDDCSTDNTEQIVRDIQSRLSNVAYLKNFRQKGPSGARNSGILKSSGDYIAFLDSDDIWLPEYLACADRIFTENPDLGVLFSNFYIKNFSTKEIISNFFEGKPILKSLKTESLGSGVEKINDDIVSSLIQENFFSLCGAVFRRSILNDTLLNEMYRYGEDRDFAVRLSLNNNVTFAYRTNPAFVAYRHGDNMCSGNSSNYAHINAQEGQIKILLSYIENYELDDKQKNSIVKSLIKYNKNLMWLYKRTFQVHKYLQALRFRKKLNNQFNGLI